ncbi:hypothetical protein ACFLY0_00050 [Patescibacteria group bacterium]
MKIGFIGQGWIGKNYADNFEDRGYDIVRYAKEEPYLNNKEEIATCDVVYIAVPTPTTNGVFDDGILRNVIPIVGDGKIAVIKSTITPGTTRSIQKENPSKIILHSPEFLSEATARYDADNPSRNIIGTPLDSKKYQNAAQKVISALPKAEHTLICSSEEAEIIKYAHNVSGFIQVILFNFLYDYAIKNGCDWEVLKRAFEADPLMASHYANPVHKSGRGAGGNCFIKDFAAFGKMYAKVLPEDTHIINLLSSLEEKNKELLLASNKDLDILRGVYGNI